VNSAGISLLDGRTVQGQGYAIGVDRVKEVVPGLAAGRSVGWNGMGFVHVTDPDDFTSDLRTARLPHRAGLVVNQVVPGTPAAAAGFGTDPVMVTAVNDQRMDGGLPAYCAAIGDGASGTTATFSVIDPGATRERTVEVPFR
jgi:S1-C subfamily serine protease